jgi:putative transposase
MFLVASIFGNKVQVDMHQSTENRRTQARFRCVECGYENHADVVGAINILERGLRLSACGEEGAGLARKRKTKPASRKQEPAEETHALAA